METQTFKKKEKRLNDLWEKFDQDDMLTPAEYNEMLDLENELLRDSCKEIAKVKPLVWPKSLVVDTTRGKVLYKYNKDIKKWVQQTKGDGRKMYSLAFDITEENEDYIAFIDMLTKRKLFTFFIKKCIRWYKTHPEALEDLLNR
jgi:hypothetical protein|nr:MAG TPA_asm: hypothetical protein [Caudoviricetes sp.]